MSHGIADDTDVAPTRVDALSIFEQSLGASTVGVTVVRVRGVMRWVDTDPDVNVITQCRATCYIGTDNEVARGPAGSDNTFGDLAQNKDFFLYEPFMQVSQDFGSESYDLTGRMIDVKASRKIEELNQTIVLDASGFSPNAGVAGTGALLVDLSFLLMLP